MSARWSEIIVLPRCAVTPKQNSRGRCGKPYFTQMDSVLGGSLLSVVWYEVAKRIVHRAVEVYGLTEEQAAALHTVFLRPNDYRVTSGSN